MSKKQWIVLLILFLLYLLFGAFIFYVIESPREIDAEVIAIAERIEIHELLHTHYTPSGSHNHYEIMEKLTKYCGKSVFNYTNEEYVSRKWDFYNSFYFAYTVVSTIGYGNLAPTNMLGRILMIFYALVGIPINGILLSQLGEFFSGVFIKAHEKYKAYKDHQIKTKEKTVLQSRLAGFAAQVVMYLVPGFVMFIFFPAFLFSHYEGWSYDEAVYYAFVTLTTIGFGDYVAGQDNSKGSGVFFILYKIFLIFWISFGLGYIVMIMTFIARGYRSKKIARIEHKLAANLKHTQSKIWDEFIKDVSFVRRVFNEIQFSRVKRVYVDEYDYYTPPPHYSRSNSFPNLRDLIYGGLEVTGPPRPRRRANSEVVPSDGHVARVVSETDLQRIDKNATFAAHAMVQPAELLARLVSVLGYMPPSTLEDDEVTDVKEGVQGFSDKEILSSETPDGRKSDAKWIIGDESFSPLPTGYHRSRASSEVRLNKADVFQPVEWTWSGPAASTKIQEIMKARKSLPAPQLKNAARKSRFPSFALPQSFQKNLIPRWVRQLNRPSTCERRRSALSVNDVETVNPDPDFSSDNQNLDSVFDVDPRRRSYSRSYFTHTGAGTLADAHDGATLLEETSLADFLRALTALHARVGAVPDDLTKVKPQRKLGTASLTPPKLPSLFTLFSPQGDAETTSQSNQNTVTSVPTSGRRFSLRNVENSGSSTPSYRRKGSAAQPIRPRRFSLRPVVTPTETPPHYSPSFSVRSHRVESPSPPPYFNDPFVADYPQKPLVQMESAPGVSSPMVIPQYSRRFSLRPAKIDVPPAPATPKPVSIIPQAPLKPVPRWKGGLLQRQLGQKNIQKRVRALSLSDVYSDPSERNIGISPLALEGNARTITTPSDTLDRMFGKPGPSMQKTVTIISKDVAKEPTETNPFKEMKRNSKDGAHIPRVYRRYNSESQSSTNTSPENDASFLDFDNTIDQSSQNYDIDDMMWEPLEKFEQNKHEPSTSAMPDIDNPPSNDDLLSTIIHESDSVSQSRKSSEASDQKSVSSDAGVDHHHNASKLSSRQSSVSEVKIDIDPPATSSTTSSDPIKEFKFLGRKPSATSQNSRYSESSVSRKPSIVSIEPWCESHRSGNSRKISAISSTSSWLGSRKTSNQSDKHSIDSESLAEVKVEVPPISRSSQSQSSNDTFLTAESLSEESSNSS